MTVPRYRTCLNCFDQIGRLAAVLDLSCYAGSPVRPRGATRYVESVLECTQYNPEISLTRCLTSTGYAARYLLWDEGNLQVNFPSRGDALLRRI
jgi:hypothetical protein